MSQNELLNVIRQLNKDVKVDSERNRYLKKILAKQPNIIGIMISKPTGKCIGTIEKDGKINHVSNKEAKSPYNIVVKDNNEVNIQDMLVKNDLHGLPADKIVLKVMTNSNMKILGQTVNIKGKIVGLIIRMGKSNNYIQTQQGEPLGDIPILAILHKSSSSIKPKPAAIEPRVKPPTTPDVKNKKTAKLVPSAERPQGECIKPSVCTAEPVVADSGVKSSPINNAIKSVRTQVSNLWQRI
jgi:hypothetical protein